MRKDKNLSADEVILELRSRQVDLDDYCLIPKHVINNLKESLTRTRDLLDDVINRLET